MKTIKKMSVTIALITLITILLLGIAEQFLSWNLQEDGSVTVWSSGSYDLIEHNTADIAGKPYTYLEKVNDTRNIILSFQIPFVFGDSPEWWNKLAQEEFLTIGEYSPNGPIIQDDNIILSGWNSPNSRSFWDCFHSLNVCFLRHDSRPIIFR